MTAFNVFNPLGGGAPVLPGGLGVAAGQAIGDAGMIAGQVLGDAGVIGGQVAGDVNAAFAGVIPGMPDVNIDTIAVPGAAGAFDKAGNARLGEARAQWWGGNLPGAAQSFQQAAQDFEAEAQQLLAGMNGGPVGGGAPAPAPAPTPANPVGGGAPPAAPQLPPPAPPVPPTPLPPTPPAAATSPWTVKTNNLDPAKGSWSSVGDPHETNGDGLKFDNEKTGKFDLIQSASGDFRVQNDQGPDTRTPPRWPGATLNHAVAIKDGNDTVAYDVRTNQVTLGDGTQVNVPLAQNPLTLPGGGKLENAAGGALKFTSSKGDVVNIKPQGLGDPAGGAYIDLSGQLGPNRKDGEVRGGLGEFHDENDVNRDFKGRTGDDIMGKPGNGTDVSNFEETWRASDDMFPKPKPSSNPTGGGAPTSQPCTTPNQWTVKTNPLTANNTFASVGDPHETTGDGLKFDNEKTGQFDLLKSANGDLLVQNDQGPDPTGRWPGATLNHKIAIQDIGANGTSKVQYDGLSHQLTVDGKSYNMDDPNGRPPNPLPLASGGHIEFNGKDLKVVTSKNDEIDVKQQDKYLDITGKLGNRKDGEVRGALGEFHMEKDQNRDLKGRTGDDIIGKPGNKQDISNFEDAWRAQPDENLFAPAAAANPAGGGAPAGAGTPANPVGGGAPPANGNALDIQAQIREAIRALNKAGEAHRMAGRAMLRQGNMAGAASEFDLASKDFEQVAQLVQQLKNTPPAGNPVGGGAPPAGTPGGLPQPMPAPMPVHRERMRHHHHRGFLAKMADFAGGIADTFLKAPGGIFNPFTAPIGIAAEVTSMAFGGADDIAKALA